MIYFVCTIITFISLTAIYNYGLGWNGGAFMETPFPSLVGMGLPLFFNIGRRDIRNVGLTICLIAIFLRSGLIGMACVGITYTVMFFRKWFLFLWIPAWIMFYAVVYPSVYPSGHSIPTEVKTRASYYQYAIDRWPQDAKELWFGKGFRAWSKMPENQVGATSVIKPEAMRKKWLHTLHSDFLQLAFEFGVVATFIVLFLLLFPAFFMGTDSRLKKTLMASYLCLMFQFFIDFPFHRLTTGVLGLWVIGMMYREVFGEDSTAVSRT